MCEIKANKAGADVQKVEPKATENHKSFSHYDLQLQKPRDYIDDETRDGDIDEAIDDDDKDIASMRTVLEVEGVDHKILLVRPNFNTKDPQDTDVSSSSEDSSKTNQGIKIVQSQNECCENLKEKSPPESHGMNTASASKVDHSAVLREYVEKSSSVNNTLSNKSSAELGSETSGRPSSNDWSKVELRIVEPSDTVPDSVNVEKVNSANEDTDSHAGIESIDDNDDVVFIDEFSPSMRTSGDQKENVKVSEGNSQDVDSSTPTPKQREKQPSETVASLPSIPQDSESNISSDIKEESDTCVEDDQSGLMALPVRSPTPPKRSPRRSPRTPKNKEKNHERHASLDISSSDQKQQLTSISSSVSTSPVSKNKELGINFTFSTKKGRSKSVSSLSSKKSKDKEKVVRSESEDAGAVNRSMISDVEDDSKCENPSGKRVGVRSMVIDGTIKRNFIVIHPSDDSETIGLAPLSSFTNGSKTSIKTPKALSSVKSHITGMSSSKLDSTKNFPKKQDLKGVILSISKENVRDRESLKADSSLEKAKSKKGNSVKKQTESRVHGSSVSLSSTVCHANSKVAVESSEGMSEVDCDLVNVSPEGVLPLSSTKTTSRLCVIM